MCRVKAIGAEQKISALHRGIWCRHSLHSHFSYGRCPRSLPGRAGIIFNIAYEPAGAPRLLFRTQTTPTHGHAVQPAWCSARGWNSWNHLKSFHAFCCPPPDFFIISTMWKKLKAVLLWCSKTTPPCFGEFHMEMSCQHSVTLDVTLYPMWRRATAMSQGLARQSPWTCMTRK